MSVAIITGANGGIGLALTKELVRNGYKVYATDVVLTNLEALASEEEFVGKIVPCICDVSKTESILAVKERIASEEGRLDLLYNNAGVASAVSAMDVTDEQFERVVGINLFGSIRMCREFSKMIIATKGVIAFTSSVTGIFPFPVGSMYCTSKAALTQYAATLHLEMAPLGVRVLNFITGGIDTGIADNTPLAESSIFNTPEGREAIRLKKSIVNDIQPTVPEQYARECIADIKNSTVSDLHLYRGKSARLLMWAAYTLPTRVRENYLIKKYKFDKFYEKYLSANK